MRRVAAMILVVLSAMSLWTLTRYSARKSAQHMTPTSAANVVHFQHGNVSLFYASDLARGATAVEQPAAPFVVGDIPEGIGPAHLEIDFNGFAGDGPGAAERAAIHIYPATEFARPEFGADSTNSLVMEVTLLEELLAKPAGSGGPMSGTAFMPFLPVVADAEQVVHAKLQRLETPGLTGIRFLTAYTQETVPFTEGQIFYSFQGLTPDHKSYVAATFPIRTGFLPAQFPAKFDEKAFLRDAPTYLAHTVADLEAQDDARFTPPLAALDALVRSITVAASTK